jgi:hypothetical protein
MNLELKGIENAGEFDRERIVLRAKVDTDIGNYAVFMGKGASDDKKFLSGHVPSAYWFSNKVVKAGDFVVLYTKSGTISSKTNDAGRTSYFYYWGWKQSKWDKNTPAALVETSEWSFAYVK